MERRQAVFPKIKTSGYLPLNLMKEYICVAMRGRYAQNPSLRKAGLPTTQRLEVNPLSSDILNSLTTIQKDNLIIERSEEYEDIQDT